MNLLKNYSLPYKVLAISLLLFSFMTVPGSIEIFHDPIVWFYPGAPAIYVFFIFLVAAINVAMVTNYVDGIAVSLISRAIICVVPLMYIENATGFSTHYYVVLVTFCAYFIFRNNKSIQLQSFYNIVLMFSVIWAFQVLYTFWYCEVDFWDLSYKNYMRIPIAASNVIAAYISPSFLLLLTTDYTSKKNKIILSTLFTFSLLLTKSRGGILSFMICYILYICIIKYKVNKFKLLFVGIIIYWSLSLMWNIPEVQMFMLGYDVEGQSVNATSLSSGRLDIFQSELKRFLIHPLFGNGMVFNQYTSKSGAHNFIIELLVQSGVIGTATYVIPILYVLKKLFLRLDDKNIAAWTFFVLTYIVEGLIEVTFFNYTTDILFWSTLGLLMNYINSNRRKTRMLS